MRPSIRFALLFAGLFAAVKFLFMELNVFQDNIQIPGLINNFFLLTAISLGLFFEKKKEGFGEGGPMSDIKNAMRAGAPYVLLVSGFIYFYYNTINPQFIESGIEVRMDMIYKDMERESYVDSLKMHKSEFQVMTNDEILREARNEIESNLSPRTMFTFSLLGLLILSVSYSILITLIYRKILLKEYYR